MTNGEKDRDLYLPEDLELLNKFNAIDIRTTGMGLELRKHEVSKIQLEATLRNRKTIADADKSAQFFSVVLIIFAIVQIGVVLIQLFLENLFTPKQALAIFTIISILIVIYFLFRETQKIWEKNHHKKI